ncbi:helix-turn-helix transcriptional regulator [Shimwellia blattae]|uniref:helix-turn-helix transcriptional regulator n=1 Tax=Shimwellia blattae TaxID=563 RepID=UPI00029106E9|nr:WYL domain-containing protein [Shimwellia blattae]GAB80918.1 putative transcriptional regulator [Shimwellia blattae DSM 4481 = NBRC 105725]VDY64452.1 HTH domain [Shimwellia blattae]VEC22560.1 HTH domain [Shimwellia blattae]
MSNSPGSYEKLASRLAAIIVLLHQQEHITREQLAGMFQVSVRTVFRDLNRLSSIVEHIHGDSYRLSPGFRQSLQMNDINKLINNLGIPTLFSGQNPTFWTALLKDSGLPQLLIKPLAPEKITETSFSHNFSQLSLSINEHRYCSFLYKNRSRYIQPYRLVNVKNIWYLAAMEKENLKGFLLSGITWLKISDEKFIPEKSIEQCIDEEDDVWFSLNKFQVLLHVDASVAGYFLRRSVLPGQVITQHNKDGSLEVSCKIADERQLLPWVRYWLPNLKILSPKSLQSELKAQLAEALIRFTDTSNR